VPSQISLLNVCVALKAEARAADDVAIDALAILLFRVLQFPLAIRWLDVYNLEKKSPSNARLSYVA
jgi:hypothetical protein